MLTELPHLRRGNLFMLSAMRVISEHASAGTLLSMKHDLYPFASCAQVSCKPPNICVVLVDAINSRDTGIIVFMH